MEHNLLTRYREYLRRREELLTLRRDLEIKPTETRIMREVVLSEALTKVHQSVMAAIYERTRLHAQRYKLDALVKGFMKARSQSKRASAMKSRIDRMHTSDRYRKTYAKLAEELDQTEQELMAEAIKQIDRIIDLESRNE